MLYRLCGYMVYLYICLFLFTSFGFICLALVAAHSSKMPDYLNEWKIDEHRAVFTCFCLIKPEQQHFDHSTEMLNSFHPFGRKRCGTPAKGYTMWMNSNDSTHNLIFPYSSLKSEANILLISDKLRTTTPLVRSRTVPWNSVYTIQIVYFLKNIHWFISYKSIIGFDNILFAKWICLRV